MTAAFAAFSLAGSGVPYPRATSLKFSQYCSSKNVRDRYRMIHLTVTLDSSLVRRFREGGWKGFEAAWADLCESYSIVDLGEFRDFFRCDEQATLNECLLLEDTVSFLSSNLRQSIEHISRWLPELDEHISQSLTVVFLPYGKYTFSPKPGLQFFSLDPHAASIETYLFLVHVYYHEVSSLNDTPNGKRCSYEQLSARDFKEWIKLLIRNEGIGNYAILEHLRQFLNNNCNYVMQFFTYARKINEPKLLRSAIYILDNAFASVNDENVIQFSGGINKIFRNESLPVLNLVGIHMAECIASNYDVATLKNVYQRESEDFFRLYSQTHAPFAKILGNL